MPGPHDLAVRIDIVRPHGDHATTSTRPPHLMPNDRDDRDTPLLSSRDSAHHARFPKITKRKILASRPNITDPFEKTCEINFSARTILVLDGHADQQQTAQIAQSDLPV